MNAWTRLAEANAKNYNNHPALQLTIVAVGALAAAVLITRLARRLGRPYVNPYNISRYTK